MMDKNSPKFFGKFITSNEIRNDGHIKSWTADFPRTSSEPQHKMHRKAGFFSSLSYNFVYRPEIGSWNKRTR